MHTTATVNGLYTVFKTKWQESHKTTMLDGRAKPQLLPVVSSIYCDALRRHRLWNTTLGRLAHPPIQNDENHIITQAKRNVTKRYEDEEIKLAKKNR